MLGREEIGTTPPLSVRVSPEQLNCPADVGLVAAVTVLAAIDSMKSGKRITLKPDDFRV